jgi:hypothetical protein
MKNTIPCPLCKGQGGTEDVWCPDCSGTGEISEPIKVEAIHIGNVETGINIGYNDGSLVNLPMTENCYKERQREAESFAEAVKDYALENLEHSLSVSIAVDYVLTQWGNREDKVMTHIELNDNYKCKDCPTATPTDIGNLAPGNGDAEIKAILGSILLGEDADYKDYYLQKADYGPAVVAIQALIQVAETDGAKNILNQLNSHRMNTGDLNDIVHGDVIDMLYKELLK